MKQANLFMSGRQNILYNVDIKSILNTKEIICSTINSRNIIIFPGLYVSVM